MPPKPSPTRILPVILAGGGGTRLWPLSRSHYPKQFLALGGDDSLLQQTLTRLAGGETLSADPPIVVCNEEHRFLVAEQARLSGVPLATIMLEPAGHNTAPALSAAACFARRWEAEMIAEVGSRAGENGEDRLSGRFDALDGQVAERHADCRSGWCLWKVDAKRRLEIDEALTDELHDENGCERLRDRSDAVNVIGRSDSRRRHVGHPQHALPYDLAVAKDARRDRGHPLLRLRRLQAPVESDDER